MKKSILFLSVIGLLYACGSHKECDHANVTDSTKVVVDSAKQQVDQLQNEIDGLLNEI